MGLEENYDLIGYAETDKAIELQSKKVWLGIYRGVRFEINNFRFGPTDTEDRWTHYIAIWLEQLPEELQPKFWLDARVFSIAEGHREHITHDTHNSIISSLEFHGGCTFYDKIAGLEGGPKAVKIGCDYQHYWDVGKQYDVNFVYSEVKETIDSLYKLANEKIKVRSWGDGKYRLIEEFKK